MRDRVSHAGPGASAPMRVALIGNPNTGKTSVFNRLVGVRHRTANFPGTTQEYRLGRVRHTVDRPIELIDLPGIEALGVDQSETRVCRDALSGAHPDGRPPDAVCVVVDSTRPVRGLRLVHEVGASGIPVLVALNMQDIAQRRGVVIDTRRLASLLGSPVVATDARCGVGLDELARSMPHAMPPRLGDGSADPWSWAERRIDEVCIRTGEARGHGLTEGIDRLLLHPVLGGAVFALVMGALFWTIFALADVPMGLIDRVVAQCAGAASRVLPEGAVSELVSEGIIGGVGATIIFLPQIVILFFLISLLEGTGYLSRAALLMDRVLRPFGLPGTSFVPMLSAHACAIPAIMSCRGVPGRRERLATILVAPFLSCSARIPVYVLLTGLLFSGRPAVAALAFAGCYALGAVAALVTALLARSTILRGSARPMVLDLPDYKLPSVRAAMRATLDRARSFLKKAGTVIVAMMIVLWWLGEYPHADPPRQSIELRERAAALAPVDAEDAETMRAQADWVEARHAGRSSFLGRAGRAVQPVFEPIGFDWQITVGVLGSFAAREVFVSTLSVVVAGSEDAEDARVLERLRRAERDNATPLLTPATSASLLVFYVLAMQCLPTLAVTAAEAGGWRWAALQFGWMSVVAYAGAFLTYQMVLRAGLG